MIENQLCHGQISSEVLFGRGTMKVQPDHRQDDSNLSQAFSAPIPEVDSLRYPRRFVYRYNSPFSVSRQFNLISCMRKTLTGKIAARLTSPQFPRIDQISPKSCRA